MNENFLDSTIQLASVVDDHVPVSGHSVGMGAEQTEHNVVPFRLYSGCYDKKTNGRPFLPGAFDFNCHMLNDLSMGVTNSWYDPKVVGWLIMLLAGDRGLVRRSLVSEVLGVW